MLCLLWLCPISSAQDDDEASQAETSAASQQEAAERQHRAALEELKRQKQTSEEQRAMAEEQRAMAEKQRAIATEQYQRAMSELEKVRRRGPAEAQAEMEKMRARLEAAHAQLAELTKQAQQAATEPLPADSHLQVFKLRHTQAHHVAGTLASILRNSMPRIAVDERANMLVVAGNEKQMSIVSDLVETLDQEIREDGQDHKEDTLQVRIVWLLDVNDGLEPNDKLVSPQVVEALGELGFEHPKVVCQQVITLTLGEGDADRRGQFNFQIPVLIQSQPWQLQGTGDIEPIAGERFNLRFDLRFHHSVPGRAGWRQVQQGQLGGSIYTPLGHYTVMGTTTFVAQTSVPTPFDKQPGDAGAEELVQNQHLSAFVVYIDRAREFPGPNTFRKADTDENRR